jgi:hypothetical protein
MAPLAQFNLNLDSNDAKAYVAIAVGVLGLAYLWLRQSRKRKDPLEKAPFSSLSQQRAVERQMQSLLVEMAEMVRQMTAAIDTRAARLNLLIEEADRRIAELQRLGVTGPTRPDAANAATPRLAGSADPPADLAGIEALSDGPDPRHADIYALAADGLPAHEIARRLSRPRGEVELILALRPRPERRATG